MSPFTKPYKFIGFGAMDVTKPYKFIGFGAMDVTKPYKSIGFAAKDVTKPYKFIGFGAMDVTKPYKFIGFGPLPPQCPGYRSPRKDRSALNAGVRVPLRAGLWAPCRIFWLWSAEARL